MQDPATPTGPEERPEPGTAAEIEELLRQVSQSEECQRRAFALLQRYRGECFAAIARCGDLPTRQEAVRTAREELRRRLLELLTDCTHRASPAETEELGRLRSRLVDPDLLRMEGEYRADCEREVMQAERLFRTTYAGILEHEKRLNMIDGLSESVAEAAAQANLALRLRGLEDELRELTRHHRKRYERRLRELVAMQEDR